MNDFKSAYQSAVQDMNVLGMKEIHIDAVSCMDVKNHKKRKMKQVQRVTTTAFSAICIIFVCSIGTVKAAEYFGNVITVNEWGFQSGDVVTMTENDGEICKTFIVEEEIATKQETVTESETDNASTDLFEEQQENMADKSENAQGVMETELMPVKNYTSWEELKKDEDILFPQPSISIGEKIDAMDITVCGNWAMVRYDVDGKVLWMERTNYADTQGHAASKAFPGGVCNERSYTDSAGYTYTLLDSVKEKEENPLQIHAAVSVGSYEVFMDFMGYEEEEVRKILDSVDLSLYE